MEIFSLSVSSITMTFGQPGFHWRYYQWLLMVTRQNSTPGLSQYSSHVGLKFNYFSFPLIPVLNTDRSIMIYTG